MQTAMLFPSIELLKITTTSLAGGSDFHRGAY